MKLTNKEKNKIMASDELNDYEKLEIVSGEAFDSYLRLKVLAIISKGD